MSKYGSLSNFRKVHSRCRNHKTRSIRSKIRLIIFFIDVT
nr:MAG TPA: hypothetical protein [Caudoviricetes sp.]